MIWYVVPILLFFLVSFAFFLKPVDLSKTTLEHKTDPLTPNTVLQLVSGEVYAYEYNLSGELSHSIYTVTGFLGGCMGVRAEASNAGAQVSSDFCLDVESGEITRSDFPLDFFQPWMLTLPANLFWSSETIIVTPSPIEL